MSTPLRVTLLKSTLSRLGGLEKYALNLAKAFQLKNCNVTLLTTGDTDSISSNIFTCSHIFSSRLSFRKITEFDFFCEQHLSKHPSDVVFSLDRNRHQTHLRAGNGVHAAYLMHRKKQEGLLKSLSFSCNPLHRLILNLEKAAFEDPLLQVLFTNSHMVKKEILSFYRTDPSKIQVVHNGVEWTSFQPAFDQWPEKKTEFARSLGLNPNLHHFLFIGHNFQRKGLDLLLKALALLLPEDFHLSVVGKDKNERFYKRLCSNLGLATRVTFFGARRDALSFYQLADTLVIPSLYDPFANVTVEALAMGLFVISSKTNGGHEVLSAENGAVIPDLNDVDSFSALLKNSLTRNKTALSANQIRSSVKPLDFPNQLSKIVDLSIQNHF